MSRMPGRSPVPATDTEGPGGLIHGIVLAGGTGERLGRVSKADLVVGGRRLLDRVLEGARVVADGTLVVVAPDSVEVPDGCQRVLEDPPGGGPLAGLAAGLDALPPPAGARELVLVCGVDTPGIGALAVRLTRALAEHPGRDGAIILGGQPEAWRQYLQGLYRRERLGRLLEGLAVRNRGVTRTLRGLDLIEVPAPAEECRDLDKPADLAWWDARVGVRPGGRLSWPA